MKNPRQSFVVIIQTGKYIYNAVGPYRSFKKAENDAKAFSDRAFVLPIIKPEEYIK